MAKITPTPELLAAILACIPEGFMPENKLSRHLQLNTRRGRKAVNTALEEGWVAREHGCLYDTQRLSGNDFEDLWRWCSPDFPPMTKDGLPDIPPIRKRRIARIQYAQEHAVEAIIEKLDDEGYAQFDDLVEVPGDKKRIEDMIEQQFLRRYNHIIFDPLRYSKGTIKEIERRLKLTPLYGKMNSWLHTNPVAAAPRDALINEFGEQKVKAILSLDKLRVFSVRSRRYSKLIQWIASPDISLEEARNFAEETVKIPDEEWDSALQQSGDLLRKGASDKDTRRDKVLARTFTIKQASRHLGLKTDTIIIAIDLDLLTAFTDPEGKTRLPAEIIEQAGQDVELLEKISAYEPVKMRDIALTTGQKHAAIRSQLKGKSGSHDGPVWGDIRGKWGLPKNYREFRVLVKQRKAEQRAERKAIRDAEKQRLKAEIEAERRRRTELRERLVAAFPTWRHDGRIEQHITLHIGQPNSGKTHDSLEALAQSGYGWYLAPLRLLAFEIFDRFNQQGIPCNLLTGEEFIPVEGATITAATIEMFNPGRSGNCIVIDEAQMLADTDRGWAWTRALMESQAPEMHVIGPLASRELIEKLAEAAALSISVVEHERLAPLQVSRRHWTLENLPPSTILVAFSRRTVLQLKSELEDMGRKVSVIYGALPPEVRRNQVERFASGENNICVATDAVGMGLNLPADNVCFYEIVKFDGISTRVLTPAEIIQIGGRAGRYGFSKSGIISSIMKEDLRVIRQLYEEAPRTLTHARVAPTAEDLALLSGHLGERLQTWSELSSIPETLRGVIKTADLTERIELANMLSMAEIEHLGLEKALKLVNAPARQSTHLYWLSCAKAILTDNAMPLPNDPPQQIVTTQHLEFTETCIAMADIYLWLSRRPEFRHAGSREDQVRSMRTEWTLRIDEALVNRLDTRRRCAECNRIMHPRHPYKICDACYYSRRNSRFYSDF